MSAMTSSPDFSSVTLTVISVLPSSLCFVIVGVKLFHCHNLRSFFPSPFFFTTFTISLLVCSKCHIVIVSPISITQKRGRDNLILTRCLPRRRYQLFIHHPGSNASYVLWYYTGQSDDQETILKGYIGHLSVLRDGPGTGEGSLCIPRWTYSRSSTVISLFYNEVPLLGVDLHLLICKSISAISR